MYGFDRDSRRAWRRRILTLGEDQVYGYDGLSQVVRDARGNLNINGTAISAVPASEENWDYDPTGNWRGYATQSSGTVTLDQHRVHDKGNRLTQIEGDPSSIILDRAGRILQVPPDASGDWDQSLELKWDAWGRITQVKYAGDEDALGNYAYDGMTRRVAREVWDESEEEMVVHHSYFSRNWRPLEERRAAGTTASMQYLWGARHRDDLIRRDRDANNDGSLDETRYVLMDYFSPASIVDETGAITERYGFSAFGIRRIMAPDFSPRSTSECAWEFAFQGQFFDTESGFLNYGYRYYSPHLGRWMCKDPIEERGGANLYTFTQNEPLKFLDHLGLSVGVIVPPIGPQIPISPGHPDNDPSNLGTYYSDPYPACLNDGWTRHCINSCILQRQTGWSWLTQLIAQANGSDLPWDPDRDPADIDANQAGIDAANSTYKSESCVTLCHTRYDSEVMDRCCRTNLLLKITDSHCTC